MAGPNLQKLVFLKQVLFYENLSHTKMCGFTVITANDTLSRVSVTYNFLIPTDKCFLFIYLFVWYIMLFFWGGGGGGGIMIAATSRGGFPVYHYKLRFACDQLIFRSHQNLGGFHMVSAIARRSDASDDWPSAVACGVWGKTKRKSENNTICNNKKTHV